MHCFDYYVFCNSLYVHVKFVLTSSPILWLLCFTLLNAHSLKHYTTDYKLALWATLVFFVYGSSLQGSAGLLMCLARLVLHSRLEPYRDHIDNLFDCKLASSNPHRMIS